MAISDDQRRLAAAVRDVKLGVGQRQAALRWDVPRSTIQRRLQGIPTRKQTYQHLQALSPHLEKQLANWAIGQARLGFAPAIVKFKFIAEKMLLSASGSPRRLGKEWHTRFLARNSEVKSARSKSINYTRVNGATAANINIFFDRLEVSEIANIPPERFFNTDEIGIGQGVTGNHYVICEATTHLALKKAVEKGEWITCLECVSGAGVALPPLIIFKGVDIQAQWYPDVNRGLYEDWRFRCSPKGWTSNEIALDWIKEVFIPHIRTSFGNIWVVLVCDGYESHTNNDFLWLCLSNKIWLVFYEPHCSHVVQVLDVGVFGSLKKKLKKEINESLNSGLGLKPSKQDMVEAYRLARNNTLQSRLIKRAWETAGIWPRDRQKPLSSKYVILEEEGVARTRPGAPTAEERPVTPDFLSIVATIAILTPSTSQELERTSKKLAKRFPVFNNARQRLFSSKVGKALDLKAEKIALLEAQVEGLQAKLGQQTSKKRKKVKPAPGYSFVRMTDVRKVK